MTPTGLPAQPGQLDEVVRARLPRSTAHGELLVPLRPHGKILGLAMLRRRPGREDFDQVAVFAARQLGAQTALTLRAAALYQREAHNADVLQRSMLPTRPPDLPGVQVAYRYGDAIPQACAHVIPQVLA